MALVSMVQSFVLIIQNDRTSILFGKLECILKLSPCSTKGKVIKESNKNNVVKQTSVKTSDGPCACRLKPTKTNFKKNNTVNCGLSQLSPCVSRELGRCHLLSEMWRSGPGHLLAHCLRTTEQLSVCVLMFACVCVSCWETYPTCEPTPNLTAVVSGSGLLAEQLLYFKHS